MFSRFLLFFGAAGAGLCATEAGRRRALRGGDRPARIWCTIPRKTLLFRQRAPRLWDQRRRRRAGRGASPPANPCSFVDGHHVFGVKGAAGEPDVVLHSPQNLALSSTGTTSLGPKAPPASDPIIISPRGKELTTNALSLPFVVNSNHSFTPPALICILRHKN